jgi:hypothetical protein
VGSDENFAAGEFRAVPTDLDAGDDVPVLAVEPDRTAAFDPFQAHGELSGAPTSDCPLDRIFARSYPSVPLPVLRVGPPRADTQDPSGRPFGLAILQMVGSQTLSGLESQPRWSCRSDGIAERRYRLAQRGRRIHDRWA